MSTKIATSIDLAQNELLNAVVQNLMSDPGSPVAGQIWFNTSTSEYKYYDGTSVQVIGTSSAAGTVTSVSGENANGFTVSVEDESTTPEITVGTSVDGLLKGNGTGVSAAAAGTDYLPPDGSAADLTGFPTLNQNTTGTAANLSGTPALPNGTTATTQSAADDSAKIATTAYADGAVATETSRAETAEALLAPKSGPTFTGTVTMSGATEVTVPAPSNASDAATKSYVDAAAQGLSVKPSARAATTGAETYTVTSGSVTQISGTTVDGASPAVGDYILVKDAPAASGSGSAGSSEPGNGLYQVTSNTTNLSVSRAAAMSGSNGPAGAYVFVEAGTDNASAGYVVSAPSTDSGFTYGTDDIQWTQFSGAGEITAGAGLAKSGNTLGIENSGVLTTAHGGTGGATVAAAKSSLGFGQVYNSGAIGDGSSVTLTVTHDLDNAVPVVMVWDVSGSYPVQVICDVTAISASAVQLGFGTAPASGSIKCVVVG